jgi:hypothetical protein
MQPPALVVHPEAGFVIVDHPAGLQGRFDPHQHQAEGTGTLLTSSQSAGLGKRGSQQIRQDLADACQGEQMPTSHMVDAFEREEDANRDNLAEIHVRKARVY